MKRSLIFAVSVVALLGASLLAWAQHPDDRPQPEGSRIRKPQLADTVKANMYADNWFVLYINGELAAVDSIRFMPHNVVSVDILPAYPMTIAVMAKDNADARTGMEYANTSVGDAGFILKFGDGTVTSADWKAKKFSWGPIDGDTRRPRVENIPLPENWYAVDFDDSAWGQAKEYTQEQVGPKQPFFEHDFQGAKFIWTDDIELDNTVLFRHVVKSPPDGKPRIDFSNLNNVVPAAPPRPGPGGKRPQQ
ncbi:hypothetical protein [Lignipirellula cremea]|uniref:Uncharacterized protein n=1 Tax=Lignipirellula cremea TaxID=2528010 RepID=A0A518E3D6_9BACT|nr:hypothetical protein [Lignipirellula cremea]QDU98608.1 hypothetical protein Pla8534_64790 [Lignipirellula cremea]